MVRAVLNMLCNILLWVSRFIGDVYSRLWAIFKIPWFDHRFDHLRGPENWYWTERGVLGRKLLTRDSVVLDLCCGDGIFSGLYYSTVAKHVDAVDRNGKAIRMARRRYTSNNVTFHILDVLKDNFPRDQYNVIFFFVSIEHFSAEAGTRLLQKIAGAVDPNNGVLFGSTPIFHHRGAHNYEHDNEFLSLEQLRTFLTPHFDQVELWFSEWPGRDECYFRCSRPKKLSDEIIKSFLSEYRNHVAKRAFTEGLFTSVLLELV